MSDSPNAKQQIANKIKDSTNILVTVSASPNVDELSAALGLTLLINKLDKHATAIFSGDIPPAITFLDPEKTFENTVDSLRDFIIALDKEKADHLRYKVDGDVVKIFITPYKTTISKADLDFSQGDYNVEMVVAIGVKSTGDLDKALSAHGRILHDATVSSLCIGETKSSLGSLNWQDDTASSYSELVAGLGEALKQEKDVLDEQIATALLTGIVAATERFSNNKTSSRVMSIAATLMAAGANQQLIATKLQEAHEIKSPEEVKTDRPDGSKSMGEGSVNKLKSGLEQNKPDSKKDENNDGSLLVNHDETTDESAPEESHQTNEPETKPAPNMHDFSFVSTTPNSAEEELAKQRDAVMKKNQKDSQDKAERELASHIESTKKNTQNIKPSAEALAGGAKKTAEKSKSTDEAEASRPKGSVAEELPDGEPSLGGTLNATTDQAADEKKRAKEDSRNRTILSHDSFDSNRPSVIDFSTPSVHSPFSAAMDTSVSEDTKKNDLFDYQETPVKTSHSSVQQKDVHSEPTLEQIDKENRGTEQDDAMAQIEAAYSKASGSSVPSQPEPTTGPAFVPPVLPEIPPLPDFSTLPPLPSTDLPTHSPAIGDKLGDILPPAPDMPPPPPISNDPTQFKIPGQK